MMNAGFPTMKNNKPKLNREVNLLYEMKGEGHDLLDEIYGLGLPKDWIYHELAKRLKVPYSNAHFKNMRTIEEVERAILALTQMKAQRISRMKPKKPAKKTNVQKLITKLEQEAGRKRNLAKQRQKQDKAELKRIGQDVIRVQIARAGTINASVAKYPRCLQRMARSILCAIL